MKEMRARMDGEELRWWRAKARLEWLEREARDAAREGRAPPECHDDRLTKHIQAIWMDAKTRNQ